MKKTVNVAAELANVEHSSDSVEICSDELCTGNTINRKEERHKKQIFCDPCLCGDKQIKATHFCKTCEDPEPLCEVCAQQHTRHKASRHHEISNDLTQLSSLKGAFDNEKEERHKKQIFCDPCLCGDKQIKATHFCKTCEDPEPLCEVCAQQHTRHKASRHHEISNELSQLSNLEDASNKKKEERHKKQIFCDPCLCGDKQIKATHFCKTCEDPEPLCEVCAQQHTRQKASRHHEISNELSQLSSLEETSNKKENNHQTQFFCDPCLSGKIQTKATSFCQTCKDPEVFCEDCATQHIRQRATKSHEICSDMEQYTSLHGASYKGGGDQHQQQLFCDPCLSGKIQTKATSFCQTCKDPEVFCEDCATQHTRQRATKGHEICCDIKQYIYLYGAFSQRGHREQQQVLCDPCLSGNIQIEATSFCQTCKDPEVFCEDCAMQHTRQRATKGHEICRDIKQYNYLHRAFHQGKNKQPQKQLLCELCMYGNVQIEATSFCKTCEDPELLCKECATQHSCQRATKDHEICSDIDQFPTPQAILLQKGEIGNERELMCEPCLCANIQIKATKLCQTCEYPELLCESCAQQHNRQKATRGHKMRNDLKEYFHHQRHLKDKGSVLETLSSSQKLPGKPFAKEIKSDSITLIWEKPQEKLDIYQVRFNLRNRETKWKFAYVDIEDNYATIRGLVANSEYIFQVRAVYEEQEGPYGPVSDVIKTHESSATMFLKFCVRQDNSTPARYLLPIVENVSARNKETRTRQMILGTQVKGYCKEKTIMLVGATGSGKSTMVDGIVNYIMGVSFGDPFRLTMVTLEEEEKKNINPAIPQTEWITVYKIYPTEGSRLDYTLNIIDTPGFGDTKEIERDNVIVDQLRQLFSAQGDQGVLYIDAVGFLVKAPDARLTVVQKHIFHSIMSLFGKDIEKNICTLITFADGAQPPVLASLKESGLPFGHTFSFNNSALFAENGDNVHNVLSPMFWEMGCNSFKRFFTYIFDLETKSLCQTKDVLEEREKLKTIISRIRPQVTAALSKVTELSELLNFYQKFQNETKENEKFEFTVSETRQELRDLPKGQYVTNCLECQVTCHENCTIADDDQKMRCESMDKITGRCRICAGKCKWSLHKNTPYIYEYVTENVKKTYAEMKKRYEFALDQNLTHEKYIEQLKNDVDDLCEDNMCQMKKMNDCKTRLKEIALRPDPLSTIEHIDLLIQSEQTEKQTGFLERVKILQNMKKKALVDKDGENLGKIIQDAQNSVQTVVGKPIQRRARETNFNSRVKDYLKKQIFS
uniref:Uncharacterized protein LOC111102491 isoform X2 n=1 Tax=Crassostrea virginica TaxID=6565 RepID=A0A8B8AI59_CRAVI|nr:uncharacterized protein LOC111102491 isoform X2 [Crassostrea virginica]